jgi:hypothetical protein
MDVGKEKRENGKTEIELEINGIYIVTIISSKIFLFTFENQCVTKKSIFQVNQKEKKIIIEVEFSNFSNHFWIICRFLCFVCFFSFCLSFFFICF